MKRVLVLVLGFVLLAAACSSDGGDALTGAPTTTEREVVIGDDGLPVTLATALTAFSECDAFLDHVRRNAAEVVGPWGLEQGGFFGTDVVALEEEAAMDDAADSVGGGLATEATAPAARAGEDYSTTNVQEVGVDEPDLIKTDGERIVALAQGRLHVVSVRGAAPELMGATGIDDLYAQDMFLVGDRVLLMAHSSVEFSRGGNYYWSPISVIVEVDISDESNPVVVHRMQLDGSYLNARMIDGVVRVVVQSGPTGFQWAYPEGGGLRAERSATEANQKIVAESTLDNWLPYYILEDARGNTVAEGNLVECDRAYHPEDFSGLNLLNVVTIDLAGEGLSGNVDGVGVLADGQTVYSSLENLYVGTTKWHDWRAIEAARDAGEDLPEIQTEIHKFDISDPTTSAYVASGTVQGTVLNQYSLSEHDGYLRVATTVGDFWGWGDEPSESFVSVFEQDGGELVQVGQVGNLGLGERIFAVRYMGDIATVVTFRQTDPLYTVDLSDPTNPTVLGELKILGYSAYLHPIGDDLVIGVGQDATEEGRTLGTQVSLFDISDLANPVRVSQWTLPGGWTQAEFNPRAFLHWAPESMMVLPVNVWAYEENQEPFFGAVALDIDGDTIAERGRLSHAEPGQEICEEWVGINEENEEETYRECWVDFDYRAQINRSAVVGDVLYTVSEKGLLASDLQGLNDIAFVSFNR